MIKEALTFVGVHPDDENVLICGVLTEHLDEADAPFVFEMDGDVALVFSGVRDLRFRVPGAVTAALAAGAHFYIGNVGGSEASWLASPKTAIQ